MKRISALLATLAVLVGLAGCSGSSTPAHKGTTGAIATTVAAHVCTPQNEAMQCLLPPAPAVNPTVGPFTLFGKDFAWSKLSPPQAGSFGASYISPNDPSKGWSRALVNEYHAAHVGTVAVFEEGGTQSLSGCAQGRADAINGENYLAALGYPHSHEDLAIDFDASGPDVFAYFQCANLAEPGLVGAYGGYRPLLYLWQHHVVDNLNWQTYAWSGGLWLPASIAPLEQYLNGSAFDYDRAIAANYGQFPSPVPVDPYAIYSKIVFTLKNGIKASEYNTVKTWYAHECKLPARRRVCVTSSYHAQFLRGRVFFVAHHIQRGHHWVPVHVRWNTNHYGARYKGLSRIV